MSGLPEGGMRLMRTLVGGHFARRWDIHERGQGNVPETGPVIFASNHIGWLDGPLLFARLPRPAHALVKEEEFTGRHGRLLKFVGQIKVSRGRNDTGALRRAEQDVLDDLRTSVRVDPDTSPRHVPPSLHARCAIYTPITDLMRYASL